MSLESAIPLRIEPGFSIRLAFALLLIHSLALVVSFLLPLPWYAQLLLACVVCSHGWFSWRCHLQKRGNWAVQALEWQANTWSVYLATGTKQQADILPSSFVTPQLIVLNLSVAEHWWPYTLILFPDAVNPENLRRLRVQLKIARPDQDDSAKGIK